MASKWMTSDCDPRYLDGLSSDLEPFIHHDSSDSKEREENGENTNTVKLLPRPWSRTAIAASILLLIVSVGLVILSTLTPSSKKSMAARPQHKGGSTVLAHCGTNPQEAQARGCVWDIMSFGWVHPTCFNKEESDSWYAKYGPWEWYTIFPGNVTDAVPLTPEQLPFTPLVYTTQGYHIQHCLYIFKSLHVAAINSAPVSNEGVPMAHTDHCINLLANDTQPLEDIVTRVYLLFVKCVTLT